MNRNYLFVAERAGHRCEYCRAPEPAFNLHFDVEHIRPTSRGGTDEAENLALACAACNVFKSNLIYGWIPSHKAKNRSFIRAYRFGRIIFV